MANRKTRRQNQKNKKVEEVQEVKVTESVLNKVIIALTVICILGLFYLLTVYITNKHSDNPTKKDEAESSETAINYEEIMIGKTFSMDSDDYLVIFYDKSNSDISGVYSNLVNTYKGKEDHLSIYSVDMSNTFNKGYTTTEEANTVASKASELLINGPTLIRITNKSIAEYIEGEEDITNYLS